MSTRINRNRMQMPELFGSQGLDRKRPELQHRQRVWPWQTGEQQRGFSIYNSSESIWLHPQPIQDAVFSQACNSAEDSLSRYTVASRWVRRMVAGHAVEISSSKVRRTIVVLRAPETVRIATL